MCFAVIIKDACMYWTDHDVAPTIIADHGPDGIQRVKPSQAT